MTTQHPSDLGAGPATAGSALVGSEDEALLQALRNLWPILSPLGRRQAVNTANGIQTKV